MKESEYINATDLAKLRLAYMILCEVHPRQRTGHTESFTLLNGWIEEVSAKVSCEEDVCSVCGEPLGTGYFYSSADGPSCANCVEDS